MLKSLRESKALLLYALGVGLYLAWWNVYHEEGFLYFSRLSEQVVSCAFSFGGALLAGLAAPALARVAGGRLRRLCLALVAAQIVLGLAVDFCVASSLVFAVAVLQVLVSCTFFVLLFVSALALDGLKASEVAAALSLALIVYGVGECVIWLAGMVAPSFPLRVALHFSMLVAAAVCLLRAVFGTPSEAVEKRFAQALSSDKKEKVRVPLPLAVHAASYSVVFGMTHALASGVVPIDHEKLLPCYVGMMAAGIVFYLVFSGREGSGQIWPRVREFVFPLTMASFLLLPFGGNSAVFVSVAVAECAMDCYFAFYLLAAAVVARKIGVSPLVTASRAAIVAAAGVMVGIACGAVFKTQFDLTPQLFNALSLVVLVLLVAGTFWVGNDRRVSLVWGLEKKELPRDHKEHVMAERCARAAKEFGLTKREQEILLLLAQGQSAAAIAESNFISLNTVRTHTSRIHRKLGVHTQKEMLDLLSGL